MQAVCTPCAKQVALPMQEEEPEGQRQKGGRKPLKDTAQSVEGKAGIGAKTEPLAKTLFIFFI